MKKILLVIGIIVILLFLLEFTVLKDKKLDNQSNQSETYERMENPDLVPLGLDPEERAPSFTIQTLTGETVSLEDFRGKRILLNFWATWCPPCKEEMPDMQTLYNEFKDQDFVVLAVNVTITEKSSEVVTKFVEDYDLNFPILMDEKGEVAHQYEILSYPTSFFIDSDGIIRKKIVGGLSKKVMQSEMSLLP